MSLLEKYIDHLEDFYDTSKIKERMFQEKIFIHGELEEWYNEFLKETDINCDELDDARKEDCYNLRLSKTILQKKSSKEISELHDEYIKKALKSLFNPPEKTTGSERAQSFVEWTSSMAQKVLKKFTINQDQIQTETRLKNILKLFPEDELEELLNRLNGGEGGGSNE